MPYKINWETNISCIILSGKITTNDIINFNTELNKNQNLKNISCSLIDGTDIEEFVFDKTIINDLAAINTAESWSGNNRKVAFVVQDTDIEGAVKSYIELSQSFSSASLFKVFENVNDARDWLYLPF